MLSKHATFKCSFRPTVTFFFVFNQIFAANCLFTRAIERGLKLSASNSDEFSIFSSWLLKDERFRNLEKTDLQLKVPAEHYIYHEGKNMQISLRVN